jgi:predicted aspartyl protease
LPITINDKKYKFLLDTGAPNIISKRLANEIDVENSKKISISDSNNNIDTLTMVNVKSIKINTINFTENSALVSDLDNHFILKCYEIDGFIGSNIFRNSILKVSLKDKKITITDDIKKLKLKSKGTKLSLIGEQKSPYIKINFTGFNNEKGTEDVLIDTGMSGLYDLSNRAYAIFSKENMFKELSRSKGTSSIGIFGAGTVKEQVLVKSNKLKINNTTFENVITITTDDENSRLGIELLKHGAIVIDFKNKKFYFEAEEYVILENPVPVFTPTIIDKKYVVGFVWDNLYLDKLNFKDEIIRVANYKISEMDFCDIINLKNALPKGQSYEMELKSKDNQTKLITIQNK